MYTVEDSKKGAGEAKLPYEPSRKLIKALFPVSTLLQEEAKHQTVRLLTRNQFIQQPSKPTESQICKWYPSLNAPKNQGSTRVGYWLVITRLNYSTYKLSL